MIHHGGNGGNGKCVRATLWPCLRPPKLMFAVFFAPFMPKRLPVNHWKLLKP